MQRRLLLYNTLLLTASSLLMSGIGMAFQVWLVARIGSAGIGLYQLTLSVSNLSATFAISGIRFASTRLIAEELGGGDPGGIGGAMGRCLAYAVFFGAAAGIILWSLAAPLGALWIRDVRAVLSLRLASFSMPCISLCASLSGYFTACGRVWKAALAHFLEQLAGILLTVLFLSRVPVGDFEKSCAAVTAGQLGADALSLLFLFLLYLDDRRRYYGGKASGSGLTVRMLKIAVPLALSAYARSTLNTLQHLLVPRGLRSAGYSADGALSGYGTVQGMALPILLFPSCILSAAAELIVPELTAAQVQQDSRAIRQTIRELLWYCLLYSLAVAAFLFFFAEMLGQVIYKKADVGYYIRFLAPLVPIMYLDMVVDGCLKGLGQQVWSMGINIFESLLGLLLVWKLLPRYGLDAYMAILCFSELLNFVLSGGRLLQYLRHISVQLRPSPFCRDDVRRSDAGSGRCAYTAGRSGERPQSP